jgi:hypothetical protein
MRNNLLKMKNGLCAVLLLLIFDFRLKKKTEEQK